MCFFFPNESSRKHVDLTKRGEGGGRISEELVERAREEEAIIRIF